MINILLCDTDSIMTTTISRYLKYYGYGVNTFSKPTKALGLLESSAFDLFICEARMEPLDGFTLCEQIRASSKPHLKSLSLLIIAPENPGFEECRLMRRQDVYFLMKYKGPEKWYEKITAIMQHKYGRLGDRFKETIK